MSELTFRQRWLSAPLLSWVRRILPAMSETEREALAAGTVAAESALHDLIANFPNLAVRVLLRAVPDRVRQAVGRADTRGGGHDQRADGARPADQRYRCPGATASSASSTRPSAW